MLSQRARWQGVRGVRRAAAGDAAHAGAAVQRPGQRLRRPGGKRRGRHGTQSQHPPHHLPHAVQGRERRARAYFHFADQADWR